MATRDPNFWKRFSIAVHQDDLLKSEMSQHSPEHRDLKHSYVSSLFLSSAQPTMTASSMPSSTPGFPPPAILPRERASPDPSTSARHNAYPKPKRTRSKLHKTPSTRPLLRPTLHSPEPPSPIALASPRAEAHAAHGPAPSPAKLFHHNLSTLSLGLYSGFHNKPKFWTTITADAPRRDSWLVSQRRKARQRTWMCWLFWTGILTLVAAVVVTILVLKARRIL